MEQVRVALAWIVKYHFWLLSLLVVLISTLMWYMAAGDLDKRKAANLAKINQAFQGQQQVKTRAYHANDEVNRKQREQIAELAQETEQIWQALYERQRQEVLKWPKELPSAFRKFIADKEFGDEIPINYREQYRDYISRSFENLPKIIDANEIDESSSGAGFTQGGRGGIGGNEFGGAGFGARGPEVDEFGNPIEVDYTVYWDPGDQARIQAELDWPTTQSSWRIWVTQEDLWVYETMLRAVAATNAAKGADRMSNAAIDYLQTMQVGREAAKESRTPGRIKRLESASSLTSSEFDESGGRDAVPASGSEDALDGESDFGGGRDGFGGGGGEALSPAQEKAARLSRRYIDGEGAPVAVAPDEEPLAPDTFGQEMKRLPVRMVMQMDVRWLAMLMAQLANADLQIKVTEVRVNPSAIESGPGGGFGGRRGGGGEFGGGEFGGRSAFGGSGFGNQEILVFNRKPYMKNVVIQGVVLIFNRPNAAILKVESDETSPENTTALPRSGAVVAAR